MSNSTTCFSSSLPFLFSVPVMYRGAQLVVSAVISVVVLAFTFDNVGWSWGSKPANQVVFQHFKAPCNLFLSKKDEETFYIGISH